MDLVLDDYADGDPGWNNPDTITQTQRRKRSSRACLQCRVRKVRCDVTQTGTPCTNCRVDSQTCIIPRRSRKSRLSITSPTDRVEFGGQIFEHDTSAIHQDHLRQSEASATGAIQGLSAVPDAANFQEETQHYGMSEQRRHVFQEQLSSKALPGGLNSTSATQTPAERTPSKGGYVPSSIIGTGFTRPVRPTDPLQISDTDRTTIESFGSSNGRNYLNAAECAFLDTDSISSVPPEDLTYLNCIGCFTLPRRELLDELVRAYFVYSHPHLPLINEGEFWKVYLDYQSSAEHECRISLLVFQAVLLVACSFVSSSTIQQLGFSSVRAARSTYYRRVKALFDFDIETSNLAKAQGTLLMTFHVPHNEPHINTHWLGVAIHLAKWEGAHQYLTCASNNLARQNQLKRLWWCCIIRDRTMAVGLRRPIFIVSPSFDQVWPPLNDVDLKPEVGQTHVLNIPVKMKLLQSVTALCKLCVVLTEILQVLYPSSGIHPDGDRLELLERLYTHTNDLNEWHDATASDFEPYDRHDQTFQIVTLFRSHLEILYQSAKAALCNHRIMSTLNRLGKFDFERLQAKSELQSALRSIAQSLRAIINANMIAYSPVSMVAFLVLPSVCYNLDLRNNITTEKSPAVLGANIYQDFLQVLQLRYEGTDRALNNMSKLMSDMNLENATSPPTARSGSEKSPTRGQGLRRPSETTASTKSATGIDIIVSNPRKYVQMVNTLDFFLSRGRFPTRSDSLAQFPTAFNDPGEDSAQFSTDKFLSNRPNLGDAGEQRLNTGSAGESDQTAAADCVWEPSDMHLTNLTASDGIANTSADLPIMLPNGSFQQAANESHNFSFEDFMTDGAYSGIERFQNMLYTYPG